MPNTRLGSNAAPPASEPKPANQAFALNIAEARHCQLPEPSRSPSERHDLSFALRLTSGTPWEGSGAGAVRKIGRASCRERAGVDDRLVAAQEVSTNKQLRK